jgi:hypothetical protein
MDDRVDDNMVRLLKDLSAPPPTPREEMWARIQAERARRGTLPTAPAENTPAQADPAVIPLRPRRTVWVQWGAALAAMLLLGIGIGRISLGTDATSVPPTTTADATSSTEAADVPASYRVAASEHLQRTEVLLTSLSVDNGTRSTAELSGWARELLTNTRLLLASPAAEDAATRALLEDLELVLAQISAIPSEVAEQEVELIQEGIDQSDVLLRLRAATAGPRLVGT